MKIKSSKGLEVVVRECRPGQCPFCLVYYIEGASPPEVHENCAAHLRQPEALPHKSMRPPLRCPLRDGIAIIRADFANGEGAN